MSTIDPFALVDTFRKSKYATHDVGQQSRNAHPHRGWCLRCGRTDTKTHTVKYSDNSGMSPLCVGCWEDTDTLERVEYCRALFRSWLVGYLGAAWSCHLVVSEYDPHWKKIRDYLEQSGDGVVIPERMWTSKGVVKTWRGTWWNPWTWRRGWDVTFKFEQVRASATELLGEL